MANSQGTSAYSPLDSSHKPRADYLPQDQSHLAGTRDERIWTLSTRATLLVFAFWMLGLLVRYGHALALPPYEDQAVGVWAEADFLARTGFDYWALRYEEPHFIDPGHGARSYMISALPTLIAALQLALPSARAVFIAMHLFELVCAALTATTLIAVLRGRVGWRLTILAALAVQTMPLYSVQTELTGMDIPLATCVIGCAVALSARRLLPATVLLVAAFFVKPTGIIALEAAIVVAAAWLVQRLWRGSPSASLGRVLGQWILLLIPLNLLVRWAGILPDQGGPLQFARMMTLPWAAAWFPEAVALMAVAAVGTLVVLVRRWRESADERSWFARIVDLAAGDSLALFCWLYVAGLVAAMQLWIATPRYVTSAVPLLMLALGGCILPRFRAPATRHSAAVALAALVVWNVANRNGRFYSDIAAAHRPDAERDVLTWTRSCAFLERSHEYLDEHRSVLGLMRRLEQEHADEPILMPIPYVIYARRPSLGYVSRPLDARDVSEFDESITTFCDLLAGHDRATSPLLAWFGMSQITLPPPGPDDKIIAQGLSPDPLVFYRKSAAELPRQRQALEEWYLAQTWDARWPAPRAQARSRYLEMAGRTGQALREIEQVLHLPDLSVVHRWGLEQRRDELAALAGGSWREPYLLPAAWATSPRLALLVARQSQELPARHFTRDEDRPPGEPREDHCARALASLLDPKARARGPEHENLTPAFGRPFSFADPVGRSVQHYAALQRGEVAVVDHQSEHSDQQPMADADWLRALRYLLTGENLAAVAALELACEHSPINPLAHQQLAVALWRERQPSAAAGHLARAREAAPRDPHLARQWNAAKASAEIAD